MRVNIGCTPNSSLLAAAGFTVNVLDVADLIWVTNSLEHYTLLVERGWDADRYAEHLADIFSVAWAAAVATSPRSFESGGLPRTRIEFASRMT